VILNAQKARNCARIACNVVGARDFFMLKSGPHQIEFGHVCENPHEWEQRYEKKDLAKHRHQGQVATGATGTCCSWLSGYLVIWLSALTWYLSLFYTYLSTAADVSLLSVTSGCSNQSLTLAAMALEALSLSFFLYLCIVFLLSGRCLSSRCDQFLF
jgi:hypothetical protein